MEVAAVEAVVETVVAVVIPRPMGVEAAAAAAAATGFCWLFALWLFLAGAGVEAAAAATAVADESARLRLRVLPGVTVVDAAVLSSPEEAAGLDLVLATGSSFSFFGGGTMGEPFFICGSSTAAAIAGETTDVGVASGESIRCFFLWEGFVGGGGGGGGGGGMGCGCAVCSFSSFGDSRSFSFSLLAMTSRYRGAGGISTSSGSAATGLGVSFLAWDLLGAMGVVEGSAGVEVSAAAGMGGAGKWEVMCSGEVMVATAIGWIWGCGMTGWPRSGEFVAEAVGVWAVLSIRWLR